MKPSVNYTLGKVSQAVVDSWVAITPCWSGSHPFCHPQCPYFYECYPDEFEDIEDYD